MKNVPFVAHYTDLDILYYSVDQVGYYYGQVIRAESLAALLYTVGGKVYYDRVTAQNAKSSREVKEEEMTALLLGLQ